jgi:hypothetical protein
MDEVSSAELQEGALFRSDDGFTIYFQVQLIMAIEIGEKTGGGGMGVVLYEMAICELAFEEVTCAAIFDSIRMERRNVTPL